MASEIGKMDGERMAIPVVDNSDEFEKVSLQVVEEFLNTIVFIDDEAVYQEYQLATALKPHGKEIVEKMGDEKNDAEQNNDKSLNVKLIMDTFAPKGIICTVIKPQKEKTAIDIVEGAVKRADVLVLDWRLNSDNGEKAVEIIKNLVSIDCQDNADNQRLRLIVIYSAIKPNIVFNQMREKLSNFKQNREAFNFRRGHLSVTILHKHDITEDKLPEYIYKEFTKMTSGLVSNVAIKSMSVLRNNTHLLLSKLNPEIDPSYMAHRTLLPSPDDAGDHIIEIIASEIDSILEDYKVSKVANKDVVTAWIKHNKICESPTKWNICNGIYEELNQDIILQWQNNSIEKFDWCKNIDSKEKKAEFKENVHNTLTQIYCKTPKSQDDVEILDFGFAILTSQKCVYKNDIFPSLSLGTIIREYKPDSPNSGDYWLCIQPRCNCVRIDSEKGRSFPFLKLSKCGRSDSFDLVIKDDDTDSKYKRLKISYKIFESQTLNFKPSPGEDEIKAIRENDKLIYTSNGKKYKWVSDLKSEQAQRIANKFAAELSRVGLNESEWLRRSGREHFN